MITSGYFNSSQGDRKYTAEQMSEIFDFLLNDGVLETYGEKLFTTPATSGLGVVLGSGWAWFDQTWTKNDSSIPLMLDEPDPSLSRIDTVCLVVNKSQLVRANTFQIFKGLPSLSPQPATLQNTSTIIAHPLAYVTVPADASAISATNIEILVGKSACPFITSILQTTDITTLFQGWSEQYNLAYSAWNTNFNTSLAGWEADFNTWFEHLQTYLSEDVVTNLQLQINQLKTADTNNMATLRSEIATKVNTSDKATTVNAQSGTDDTKWMTPSKTSDFFNYRKASDTEVANGSNVTKFVTPSQAKNYGAMLTSPKLVKNVGFLEETMEQYHWPVSSLATSDGAFVVAALTSSTDKFPGYNPVYSSYINKFSANGTKTTYTLSNDSPGTLTADYHYAGVISADGNYVAYLSSSSVYIYYLSSTTQLSKYRTCTIPSATNLKSICIFTPTKLIVGYVVNSTTSMTVYYVNYKSDNTVNSATVTITNGNTSNFAFDLTTKYAYIAGAVNTEAICLPVNAQTTPKVFSVINTSSWSQYKSISLTNNISTSNVSKHFYHIPGPYNMVVLQSDSRPSLTVIKLNGSSSSILYSMPSYIDSTYTVSYIVRYNWYGSVDIYGMDLTRIFSDGTIISPFPMKADTGGAYQSSKFDDYNVSTIRSDDKNLYVAVNNGSSSSYKTATVIKFSSSNDSGTIVYIGEYNSIPFMIVRGQKFYCAVLVFDQRYSQNQNIAGVIDVG